MDRSYILPSVLAVSTIASVVRHIVLRRTTPPLPPGPKGLPFVGNVKDLPGSGELEYLHWLKYKDLYGPVMAVTVLGQTMVIIQDEDSAIELMQKRSAKHSSRILLEFGHKMCGYGNFLISQPYGDSLRLYRKMASSQLGSKTGIESFQGLQTVEIGRLLLNLLENPDGLFQQVRTETGAIILGVTYGYGIDTEQSDSLISLNEGEVTNLNEAFRPGAWAVDAVPALRYLPSWFPGMGFKKLALERNESMQRLVNLPYELVNRRIAAGQARPSYVSNLIQRYASEEKLLRPDYEQAIKYSASSLYLAGIDTTMTTVYAFILAMIKFPDAQRRAQEELDHVVGNGKLPSFEDRPQLPYINAIVNETYRWFPLVPTGFPHMTSEDDVYNGYLIPKGALLIPNVWWFLNDPSVHPDPELFRPERFLPPNNEPTPWNLAFGFGRRVCSGRLLADTTVFLIIAQALAVFHFSKALGADGNEIEPELHGLPGIIAHMDPFPYKVTARSSYHADLIRSNHLAHPVEQSDSAFLEELRHATMT